MLTEPEITIRVAWEKLNENSHKILFAVSESSKLIGSLSDGDVRRWILNEGKLDEPVCKIMNTEPIFVFEGRSESSLLDLMIEKQVECIPVVDGNFRVKKILYWSDLVGKQGAKAQKSKIDIPVVIMAGGRGVRLDPITKIIPKPLIPIGDKPVLEFIVDKFREHKVDNFFFTVNYKANLIKSYFDDFQKDYEVSYLQENEPLGTAGSLRMLLGKISSTIIVSNCDVIIESDYSEILKLHKEQSNKITIVASMRNYSIPYGVIEICSGGELRSVSEKPEFNFLVNTGFYVLEPDVLNLIPQGKVCHMTQLIEYLKMEQEKVGVFPISSSSWKDVGEIKQYKDVVSKFMLEQ